jgi:mono/diheme cytochrome c family protein
MRPEVSKLVIFLCFVALGSVPCRADGNLSIDTGAGSHIFSQSDLASRSDFEIVDVPKDVSYGRPMKYLAVPLKRLLTSLPDEGAVETKASDGFAAQIPAGSVASKNGPQAYLAIEDPAHPWPNLPGKKRSAGPFYVVWPGEEGARVKSELWPYQVVSIKVMAAPSSRWPSLKVDSRLSASDPARKGEALFETQCLACHKLAGAGSSEMGPDLAVPMNPTEYFQPDALKSYIRDPRSVRAWPAMQMPAFSKETLSDQEIEEIIAYLRAKARPAGN